MFAFLKLIFLYHIKSYYLIANLFKFIKATVYYNFTLQVLIVGNGAVGKSSMIQVILMNMMMDMMMTMMMMDMMMMMVMMINMMTMNFDKDYFGE